MSSKKFKFIPGELVMRSDTSVYDTVSMTMMPGPCVDDNRSVEYNVNANDLFFVIANTFAEYDRYAYDSNRKQVLEELYVISSKTGRFGWALQEFLKKL